MRYYAMKAMIALACIAMLAACAGAVKISPALQMDTYTDAENDRSELWRGSYTMGRIPKWRTQSKSHTYPLRA